MSYEKAAEAAAFIRSKYSGETATAIVLGSGLGAFADELENAVKIPYEQVPGFARSTVEGHAGQLVLGEIGGMAVAVQQGRFHYYEGYEMEQVMMPVRTFGLLGIKNLVLTNAAGSLNSDMIPGSLMLITDHLNCMGVNPLRGPNDSRFGPRFPDMSDVYDREFQDIASGEAKAISHERFEKGLDKEKIDFMHRGIYCGLSGPTYETPAEIRMLREYGADAVGMSTVPEAIAARHQGTRVLGISCITNLAAGMSDEPINHEEVMETGARVAEVFKELLRRIVSKIG
ncbi:MAG: purine-nucleoside phosphorylase [Pyrinomonadaceae bacterium]|nr:purine-nucleoside phosphorylase [Acidobacteriota bacterium]MBK7933201.1 purine-nucleoside phosphorylase [Acidobacteriota bacterium]MBP7377360.1 purine-nucleoside phosphorylase [Pyrinomonadaceae bacterium]